MNIKLPKRLKAIADQIKFCNTMADIGTDHGLLPIYLCLNQDIQLAYASDVAKNPLQKAIENIEKYQLQEQIIPLLGNGLKNIPQDVEVIVIAGMGGHLISKILEESPYHHNKLILQPNSHSEIVRMTLMKLDYQIINEVIVYEKDKYYEIIVAKKIKNKMIYSKLQLQYGPIFIEKKDKIWLQKIVKNREEKIRLLEQVSVDSLAHQKLSQEIDELNIIINKK